MLYIWNDLLHSCSFRSSQLLWIIHVEKKVCKKRQYFIIYAVDMSWWLKARKLSLYINLHKAWQLTRCIKSRTACVRIGHWITSACAVTMWRASRTPTVSSWCYSSRTYTTTLSICINIRSSSCSSRTCARRYDCIFYK